MAISCSRSLSSSTRRIFISLPLIYPSSPREPRRILARASLRGVGQRTRRTARQRHPEVSARAAHHRDLPAVGFDQLARDGEAEAATLDAARAAAVGLGAAAEEQVEDRLALFRRHAR